MTDDDVFRLVLLAGIVIVFPAAARYRFKAHVRGEKLDRSQEGLLILATLRPFGMLGMFGLFAFVINPNWMAWSSIPLPLSLRWAGIGIGVAGGVLMLWTLRTLGHNLTDTVVTRENATLVTTGPYRWVRHPFYLSGAMAVLANSLAAANWFLAGVGVIAVLLLAMRTRREEDNLIARFGDRYPEYMRQTGCFLPRFRRHAP